MSAAAKSTLSKPMQRSLGAGKIAAKFADGATRIADLYQKANAKIRVPKTYDGSLEAVFINTSGGMTGGDHLSWEVEAQANAKLQLSTQACEKIYRSEAGYAQVQTKIAVGESALVEWLPQETILFDESALHRSIEIDLAPTARFIGLEAVVLGRLEMGEKAKTISFMDQWRIRRGDRLIHADNIKLEGQIEDHVRQQAILGGKSAFATVLCCLPSEQENIMEQLVQEIQQTPGFGVNYLDGKIVARFAAEDMYQLRQHLIPVLDTLRGNRALPKVWRT